MLRGADPFVLWFFAGLGLFIGAYLWFASSLERQAVFIVGGILVALIIAARLGVGDQILYLAFGGFLGYELRKFVERTERDADDDTPED